MELLKLPVKKAKEEYAWVLDYLPHGHPDDPRPAYQKTPVALGVGERYFTLVEMVPKEGKVPQPRQRVYVGEGERDVIDHIRRRIKYSELTQQAKMELPIVLEKIVLENEQRFVDFYNKAYPITTRLHMLCLLPGVGKKMLDAILSERKKGEFKSFKEISERVKGLYHPEKLIARRIEEELMDENCKYRLFTS